MRRPMEIASGIAFMLVGVVYLATASYYSWGRLANPGPGFFPVVIGVLFFAGSCALILLSLANKGRHTDVISDHASQQDSGSKKLWLLLALLAAYLWTLDLIGYLIGSPLLVLFASRLMGLRSWRQGWFLALAATIGTYLVFGVWFQMPLPKGVLLGGS